MKTTRYFDATRVRPDRAGIKDEWIQRVIDHPEYQNIQVDGRIRRWGRIAEVDNKYLRVVLFYCPTRRRCTMHFLLGGSSHESSLLQRD